MSKLISPPKVTEIKHVINILHQKSGINKAHLFLPQLDTMNNGDLPKFTPRLTNCDLIEMGTEVIYNEGEEKYYLRIFLTKKGDNQTRYEDLPYT